MLDRRMPDNSSEKDELRHAFEAGRTAWPAIHVAFDTFAARAAGGDREHSADLYLACALSVGDPAAIAAFDQQFLASVSDAVSRIGRSRDFLAEVQQILRERLLVGPHAKIHDYRGGGPLAGWVRTAAVRTALNLQRATRRETPLADPNETPDAIASLLDPAVALLRQRHTADIDAALQRAIRALEPRARLLLQFYYIDGLTLSAIAAVERVGTSTVFRRLHAATEAVLAAVKHELAERLQLSPDSLDSLIRQVQDDIDLSISSALGAAS
jgi:RNA polymerase sigma-70 factor, ECF subfamily